MNQFLKIRQNLKDILEKNESKFSYTVDAWNAQNGSSYYAMTIHFINDDWNLVSTILDLVASKGRHTGKDIAQMFFKTWQDFNLVNKVQGITMDNAAANTTFIKESGIIMLKENVQFNIDDQHFRCFAHILNLGVQDILKLINVEVNDSIDFSVTAVDSYDSCQSSDSEIELIDEDQTFVKIISKIRNIVKKIRFSEIFVTKLRSCCDAVNIPFIKPILDVKTRWNSTCNMLEIIFKLKPALQMVIVNNPQLITFDLSNCEWGVLQSSKFLKIF